MREEYSVSDFLNQGGTDPIACQECGKLFLPDAPGLQFCSVDCYEQWRTSKANPKRKTFRRNEQRPKAAARKRELSPEHDSASDDDLWAARAQYWQGEEDNNPVVRWTPRVKLPERKPLILTGHGVQLRVDHGALLVRNGFTYYPQTRQEWRLFPGDWRLPSRIILLDTDGSLSLNVIQWLAQQGIPLIMINWKGKAVSIYSSDGSAVDVKLRHAQLAAQSNGVGFEIATQLIRDKIAASQKTLSTLPSPQCERAASKLELALKELCAPINDREKLMLIEARAASDYFSVWYTVQIKWKGVGRHPIPDEWGFVGKRESFLSGVNRHATDPVNAMLNYAYAILERQVLIETVAAGIDPTIGYLHSCRPPGRVSLVYDLMEPLRPEVDMKVLNFVRSHIFTTKDFLLTTKGVCRMHPHLAKRIVELTLESRSIREVVMRACYALRRSS